MARGELYIQLVVNYADDEKLADVSRSARLLYVDALCKAKATANDGILTPGQVERIAYPETPAKAKKAAGELVATGAWSWDGERRLYTIAAFLKRNKSRAQIEADRVAAEEAAALGNHKRWHVGRGEFDPKCSHCASEPRSGKGSTPRSPSGSGTRNRTESPETETETETKILGGALGDPLTPGAREPAPPLRCPKHTDRPADGPCGSCADARRAADTWERQRVTADAAIRSAEARQRADAARAEIAACPVCDAEGRLPGGALCGHDPGNADRAKRGAAAARQNLSRRETP